MRGPRVPQKPAAATVSNTANTAPAAAVPVPVAPAIAPATRQHAALPPPPARKQVPTAVLAATSSTSQADTDALENVIELVRKQDRKSTRLNSSHQIISYAVF